jgi:hypothetical protein
VIGYVDGDRTEPDCEILAYGEKGNPMRLDLPPRYLLKGNEFARIRRAAATLMSPLDCSRANDTTAHCRNRPEMGEGAPEPDRHGEAPRDEREMRARQAPPEQVVGLSLRRSVASFSSHGGAKASL